jgi:chaperonin cofactor prefoldin
MEMDEKQLKKIQIEETLNLLKNLPEGRRIFYNTGILLLEVTKQEAQSLLKEELEALEETQHSDK